MAISATDYQKKPDETIPQYTARIASLRSGDLASGQTRTLNMSSGDPLSIPSPTQASQTSANGISSMPQQDPNSIFGSSIMGLLTQYQKLGTAPFVNQQLNAQQAQNNTILNPNLQGLQGASPTQQNSAINAQASPFDQTIAGAQQGAQTFKEQLSSFGNIVNEVQSYQQQAYQNAEQKFKDLVTNFGGEGLQNWAIQNPDQASQLEKILGYGKGSLLKLGSTLKEQEQQLKAQQMQLNAANAQVLNESRMALTQSRMATAVNSIIKSLYPSTQANPINAYAASSQAINRIDQSYAMATDPKNPNKGAADLDLLDAYIYIARGGQAITEAQVETLLNSLGIKAKFDVGLQKIVGSATLDQGNRNTIKQLAHEVFGGQQKLAQTATAQINKRLSALGFDSNMLLSDPLDASVFTNLDTTQNTSAGTIRVKRISDGQTGTIPQAEFDPSIYQQIQ